jgi:hypothetical protein
MKKAPNVFRKLRCGKRSCVEEDIGDCADSASNGVTT